MKIQGRFLVTSCSTEVVYNSITSDGIQRILNLMAGISQQPWSSIRLVAADENVFVQKSASFEVKDGVLESSAIFTSAELTFSAQKIQMYASDGTLVAEADANLAENQTYNIVRQDFLAQDGQVSGGV